MADETTDASNKEQLVICIRWVDDDLIAHEDFIGMHSIERTTADVIVRVLQMPINYPKIQEHIYLFSYNLRCWIFQTFVLTLGRASENEFSN